jgi:hypothetical protein
MPGTVILVPLKLPNVEPPAASVIGPKEAVAIKSLMILVVMLPGS